MKKVNKFDQLTRFHILKQQPFFNSQADRFLKWLPLLDILTCDVLKIKTRHKLLEQIIIAALAEFIRKSSVYAIKHTTHNVRPNISLKRNSFPSGHTAGGFMCAEIMRNELEDSNKMFAFSGYSLAVVTGLLRLYKNKHWLSDVLAGAVCGFSAAVLAEEAMSQFKKHKDKIVKNHSSTTEEGGKHEVFK